MKFPNTKKTISEPPRIIAHVRQCRKLSETGKQPDRWSFLSSTHLPRRGWWSVGQALCLHTPLKRRTTSGRWQYMSAAAPAYILSNDLCFLQIGHIVPELRLLCFIKILGGHFCENGIKKLYLRHLQVRIHIDRIGDNIL